MTEIIKRDGSKEKWDGSKIVEAVKKAFISCKEEDKFNFSEFKDFSKSILEHKNDVLTTEEIQDKVEYYLMGNYPTVAKVYILYREKHKQARFIRDRIDYMKKYSNSKENAATTSETDANANVTMKNVANLEGEVYKTTNRIIQRQRIKDKLNELYPEVAKQYDEDLNNHIIYAQDEAQTPALKAYCMAATLYPLMTEGTGNIDGVTPTPPNDIQSFSGQVTNLVFLLSSQVRGAVALGDYFVALNYYVIKEFGPVWYEKLDVTINNDYCLKRKTIKDAIRKGMKQFIYGINQPAGNRSYNSPFSNINFFDEYYYKALFNDFYYPDGTKPEWLAIDKLQRIFMELLRELRLIKPLTFPVTSLCMLHDNNDCLDLKTKQWAAEEWAKGSSFFMYLSNNPNSVSSCCFSKDTKVLWKKYKESGEELNTFEELYNKKLSEIYVPYKDKWVKAKCVKFPNRLTYKVIVNNEKYLISDNHINLTKEGEKTTNLLTVNDSLLFYNNGKSEYVKITSIEVSDYKDWLYCIVCENQNEPYFTLPSGLTTHNCRVQNEITENTFNSTTGLTGIMTGSANVITLNLNRIIQDCDKCYGIKQHGGWKDNTSFIKEYLINILERVYKYQIAYKTMLYDMEDKGMYSCSNAGYIYMKKLYCTIGVIGYCEAAEFLGLNISNNKDYKDFLKLIFSTIQDQNKLHSIHDKKRPFVFNTEAIPGENLAVKLYDWDKADGYEVPKDQVCYSSYFFKQWDKNINILDKLKLHNRDVNTYCGGGQACHLHLKEHLSTVQYLKFIDISVHEGCNYFTFNIPMSECKKCGHVVNAPIHKCPKCGSEDIDWWVRIIGFLRPISAYSKPRQEEASKRIYEDNIEI